MAPQFLDTRQLKRVRQIAVDCLSNKDEEGLSYDLAEEDVLLLERASSPEFNIDQNILTFSDTECRDQFAADHFFERDQNRGSFDPIATAHEIRMQKGPRKKGSAPGRYLALVHPITDIFKCAADAVNSKKFSDFSVFDILHVVQLSLPYIENPPIESLASLCDAQYAHTKNDLARGIFFRKFGDCYRENLDLFRSMIETVHKHPKDSLGPLYSLSLIIISETKPKESTGYILRELDSSNPTLKPVATRALGELILLNRLPRTQLSATTNYLARAAADSNEEIRLAAYRAISEGALVHPPLSDKLNSYIANEDQDLLRTLASVIFHNMGKAQENPSFDCWMMALSALASGEESVLRDLDEVLADLMKKNGRHELVLAVLEKWILRNAGGAPKTKGLVKLFYSTFHELLKKEAMPSRLITSWLIRDEIEMPEAAQAILGELQICKVDQVAFSPEIVRGFDKDDLILLIRRMLGWVNYDEHLVSLLFSLLSIDGSDESVPSLVEEVLTNQVGFDYPALTCDRLRELKGESKNSETQAMCERVIKSIDGYFNDLEALPRIKELRPSQDLQIKIQKQHDKTMAETMAVHRKAAEENSIFGQIATNIPLKAGHACFSIRDGEVGESTQLHSFGHSITLPRRHVLDAVGHDLFRTIYRSTKGQ